MKSTLYRALSTTLILIPLATMTACTPADSAHTDTLTVVTTTGILADFVRNVGGSHVHVTQLIPNGADPHAYEPTLRALRDVAYADIAFTNYLLLEQHSIIRTLDANLPPTAQSVSIAEEAAKDGAVILPLIEDRSLDTAWLGMRVQGEGKDLGLNRSSEIDLSVTHTEGPGIASAFLTTTFGQPEIAFSSHDGFDPGNGYADDTMTLPANAHTHLSWGFSEPGIYRVTFNAATRATNTAQPHHIAPATATFAVGIPAEKARDTPHIHTLSAGHGDITVDIDTQEILLTTDHSLEANNNDESASHTYPLNSVIIEVPTKTLSPIPPQNGYRFLGRAGQNAYILPQAVLGKHVHGDIDPHLWHDTRNAAAYVRVIRDTLINKDPNNANEYRKNAEHYLTQLRDTDTTVSELIHDIPTHNRNLVTTHDAYAYLANAYGLKIAGFVAPHPGSEPSISDRQRLSATLRDLNIPAVFLEPQLAKGRTPITTIAQESGVKICPLYGDTLDNTAPTYIDMMIFNATSLKNCLKDENTQ